MDVKLTFKMQKRMDKVCNIVADVIKNQIA